MREKTFAVITSFMKNISKKRRDNFYLTCKWYSLCICLLRILFFLSEILHVALSVDFSLIKPYNNPYLKFLQKVRNAMNLHQILTFIGKKKSLLYYIVAQVQTDFPLLFLLFSVPYLINCSIKCSPDKVKLTKKD